MFDSAGVCSMGPHFVHGIQDSYTDSGGCAEPSMQRFHHGPLAHLPTRHKRVPLYIVATSYSCSSVAKCPRTLSTWRRLCSTFFVMTYFLIRGYSVLPKKELHRSLQSPGTCLGSYRYATPSPEWTWERCFYGVSSSD